ncbi:MAG: Clp protease ClpP [Candidatus Zapsychrus exili]|nr:Clp protease ClpP [Candidatus Zapsychrus exili]
MGIYAEYLNKGLHGNQLIQERKKQLAAISKVRGGREVLTFASALTKGKAPISIDYDDIVPFCDQINNLKGKHIDIILETPGGYAEIAEKIIKYIRGKFEHVAFIIPGFAMSAGTIMVMAGDEILMSPASALGPIDAQLSQQGKRFSAEAFLEGLKAIREEVTKTTVLNKAYIPILQNISPGEIQAAQNALDFSKILVRDWLSQYKFQNWDTHSTTGKPVTDGDKKKRAAEIAKELCDHNKWKTHGRAIGIDDLRAMKLKITDYTENTALSDAIQRYFILLKMTFDETSIFKIYETPTSQIYRHTPIQNVINKGQPQQSPDSIQVSVQCPKCKANINLQVDFKQGIPTKQGFMKIPKEDKVQCSSCKNDVDVVNLKRGLEGQFKKKIVYV